MSDKNYNSFKEYIEKRTVEDIMADYSEQRDEWKKFPLVKSDKNNNADSEIKDTDS